MAKCAANVICVVEWALSWWQLRALIGQQGQRDKIHSAVSTPDKQVVYSGHAAASASGPVI